MAVVSIWSTKSIIRQREKKILNMKFAAWQQTPLLHSSLLEIGSFFKLCKVVQVLQRPQAVAVRQPSRMIHNIDMMMIALAISRCELWLDNERLFIWLVLGWLKLLISLRWVPSSSWLVSFLFTFFFIFYFQPRSKCKILIYYL